MSLFAIVRGILFFKTHAEEGLVLVKGLTSVNVFYVVANKAWSVRISYHLWYKAVPGFLKNVKQRIINELEDAQDN